MGMERSKDGDRFFSLLKLSDLGAVADDDRRDDGFVETLTSSAAHRGSASCRSTQRQRLTVRLLSQKTAEARKDPAQSAEKRVKRRVNSEEQGAGLSPPQLAPLI